MRILDPFVYIHDWGPVFLALAFGRTSQCPQEQFLTVFGDGIWAYKTR